MNITKRDVLETLAVMAVIAMVLVLLATDDSGQTIIEAAIMRLFQ